jgi:hypothetical protein
MFRFFQVLIYANMVRTPKMLASVYVMHRDHPDRSPPTQDPLNVYETEKQKGQE